MNVVQLRDYMAEKVIPEKVMPQNIAEFLMDEEAELPELNAFTFLNRLRSLGIGSADFLYLLEGCGAPAEAVERIRRNPAMNLQSLIITLDGSGLTSQDYTRMLYTARQMWERTLTMRLENIATKPPPREDEQFVDTAEIAVGDNETDNAVNRGALPDERESDEAAPLVGSADYTSEMTAAENEEYPEPEDDPELLAAMAYYKSIFSPAGDGGSADEYADNADNAYIPSAPDVSDGFYEPPETENKEQYESSDEEDLGGYHGTEITDGYAEKYSDEYGEKPDAAAEVQPDEEYGEFEGTSEFVQIDASSVMRELTSGFDDDEPAPTEPESARREGGYHKGALISAAVGAAAVFAAGAAVSAMGFEPEAPYALRRAEKYADVFGQTLTSYNGELIGGKVFARGGGEVLGNLLIEAPEKDSGLGVYVADGYVYAAEKDGIAVYEPGGSFAERGRISPPARTEFITVFERDGAVFAVFGGKKCGFMKIEKEEPAYISEQDGVLTDIVIENGSVKLGSVYVPEFTEDFTAEQTDKYLPETGAEIVPAKSVLLSGEGCGYAVSAEYDTADGRVLSRSAVMGRAVYSSADGHFAAMEYGDGFLLAAISEDVVTETVGELICCAHTGKLTATAERGEDGVSVYLRGEDLKPLSVIKNLSEDVRSFSFSGDTLIVSGDNGAVAAIDCGDAENPKPLDLIKKTGAVKDGLALCGELSGALLTYTLYDRGGAVSSYSVTLSEKELPTFEAGGRNTLIIDSERCGFSFECFDGVCKASKYMIFGHDGAERTLYDDRTGFTAAFVSDGGIGLIYGGGAMFVE